MAILAARFQNTEDRFHRCNSGVKVNNTAGGLQVSCVAYDSNSKSPVNELRLLFVSPPSFGAFLVLSFVVHMRDPCVHDTESENR